MKKILIPALICSIMSACSIADNKVPEMASDICNCFQPFSDSMSVKTKDFLQTVSKNANPESAMETELAKLPAEEQMTVAMEMMKFEQMDNPNSSVQQCIKKVEKKYDNAYTLNEKKFVEKVVKELEAKKGCDFSATIMRIGMSVDAQSAK